MSLDNFHQEIVTFLTNTEFTDDDIQNISQLSPEAFRDYQKALRNQREAKVYTGLDWLISEGFANKEWRAISNDQRLTTEEIAETMELFKDFDWDSIQ